MENIKDEKEIHSGLRGLAVKILNRVERTDAYLDKLLEIELKNSELSSQDKALLFEIVHGVMRWMGRLDWILTGFYRGQYVKCISNIKNAMRVGLYQILFLDKVPEYAAINEAVEFVKKMQGQKAADLTNAVLRTIIRNKEMIRFADRNEEPFIYLSAFYSHPIWLVKRWVHQFGEEFTEELMLANNERPKLNLRVNNLVTSKQELMEQLNSVELKFTEGKYLDNFLEMANLSNISDWIFFKKGFFNIQDESTGISCRLLNPSAKDRVLDMCAAPGGKTAYLAELMENSGELIALEQYEARVKILRNNLDRLGVKNYKTIITDNLEFNDSEKFDKILADVPCSGLGTLTKKPDIKWKRNLSDILNLKKTQFDILNHGADLLKVGGEMVYSTCSIDNDENFEIVKEFLNSRKDFILLNAGESFNNELTDKNGCIQTYPNVHKIDGAFAAKLKKV